jgi:hypothetical protein
MWYMKAVPKYDIGHANCDLQSPVPLPPVRSAQWLVYRISQGPFPQIANRGARRGGHVTRHWPPKNSKSAIKLLYRLQVVLASAPTAKTRVFASIYACITAPPPHPHRSKCPARTAVPVAGAGQCTGCIWATTGPLHANAGSQEEPTRPSTCASPLLCWTWSTQCAQASRAPWRFLAKPTR